MITTDIMDCGEISCEYCSKDKCIYMTDNEVENKAESKIKNVGGFTKNFLKKDLTKEVERDII